MHVYKITLNVGDYLRFFVKATSQITRLRSQILAPGASNDIGNCSFSTGGQERFVSLIAQVPGEYRLEIRPDGNDPKPERYEVKVVELHPASEQDRIRLAAETTEQRAELLASTRLSGPVAVLRQSQEKYEEALALWRKCGDQKSELRVLRYLVYNYLVLGEMEITLEYAKHAMRLAEALGDRYAQASLIGFFALIYRDSGEPQKALDSINQSRDLFKELGKKYGEALAVKTLARLHMELSDYEAALSYYEEAFSTLSSLGDPRSECDIFNSMGTIHLLLGNQQKGIEYYNRALSVARSEHVVDLEAASLRLLGDVKARLGEHKLAIDLYEQSLKMCRAVGQVKGAGMALTAIGNVEHLMGDDREALNPLGEALQISRSIWERPMEGRVLHSLARVNYSLGNFDEARKQIEQALEINESIRIRVINQHLRESFFSTTQSGFGLYVDLLMQLHKDHPTDGHDAEALQANERARARSLLDVLAESQADIREGAPKDLLEFERSLHRRINTKAVARANLQVDHRSETEYFDKEIAGLTGRLREVEARIRQQSPRYAALTQPQPLGATAIQRQLDEDTVLLEFSLGEKRSWLWAVTPTSISSYQLPGSSEIELSARKTYELLTVRQPKKGETDAQYQTRTAGCDAKFQSESARLSRMLLGSIANKLRTEWKDKRLAIVAPGPLEYLPFAALPTPFSLQTPKSALKDMTSPQPLIFHHEVVNLPSASALAAIRNESAGRNRAEKSVAVIADPVFDSRDPRVFNAMREPSSPGDTTRARSGVEPEAASGETSQRSIPNSDLTRSLRSFGLSDPRSGFSRLPFSREEAEAITALAPRNSSMKATDFAANRENATSDEMSRYRIIHFATHGLLNSERPELSGMVLSLVDQNGNPQDGFLRMYEIYNLRLPADLIVLSACQTALGKEIKGEGLVGLTRGFMYAGAKCVVASLWKVDDLATAQLMKSFYRGMLKDRLRPAQALRLAQIEMLKQERWSSPFFWAPFIIQGEWK